VDAQGMTFVVPVALLLAAIAAAAKALGLA
jgi:hypothetical protein